MSKPRELIGRALPHGPVRAFFSRGSVLLTGQVAAGGLALLETVFLARALGTSGYGELTLVVTTVITVVLIIDVRVWETATKFGVDFITQGKNQEARAVLDLSLVTNIVLGLLSTAIVIALAGVIAGVLDIEGSEDALRLYALVAPFTGLTTAAAAILRVLDSYLTLTWLTAVIPLLRATAAGLGFALDLDVLGFAIVLMAAEAVGSVAFVTITIRTLSRRLPAKRGFSSRVRLLRPYGRRILRFMGMSSAVGTVRVTNERVDILVVGALTNPSVVGIFKFARTFTQPLGMFVKPYYQVIYPQLTEAASRGAFDELRHLAYRSMPPMAVALGTLAIATCVVAPFLIPLLAGSDFSDAATAVIPLAFAWFVSGTLFWVYAGTLALEAQGISLLVLIVASLLQLVALVVLVPAWEANGASVAWMIYMLTANVGMLLAVRHRLRARSRAVAAA